MHSHRDNNIHGFEKHYGIQFFKTKFDQISVNSIMKPIYPSYQNPQIDFMPLLGFRF